MKFVLVGALALALGGCEGAWNKMSANWSGYTKICVEGVSYLQFGTGAAVQVDLDGKPIACKG